MAGPSIKVRTGAPYPLGATWDGAGVNFALFSEHATKVELCLFDSADDHKPHGGGQSPGANAFASRR